MPKNRTQLKQCGIEILELTKVDNVSLNIQRTTRLKINYQFDDLEYTIVFMEDFLKIESILQCTFVTSMISKDKCISECLLSNQKMNGWLLVVSFIFINFREKTPAFSGK